MSTMRGLKRDRPVSGAGLGPSLLPGFTAVVSRPPPVASFSLCALRLFVIKRTYSHWNARGPLSPDQSSRTGVRKDLGIAKPHLASLFQR